MVRTRGKISTSEKLKLENDWRLGDKIVGDWFLYNLSVSAPQCTQHRLLLWDSLRLWVILSSRFSLVDFVASGNEVADCREENTSCFFLPLRQPWIFPLSVVAVQQREGTAVCEQSIHPWFYFLWNSTVSWGSHLGWRQGIHPGQFSCPSWDLRT